MGDNNKAIGEDCRIFVKKGKQDPNWVGLNKVSLNRKLDLTR
jgi:hypothetical protein